MKGKGLLRVFVPVTLVLGVLLLTTTGVALAGDIENPSYPVITPDKKIIITERSTANDADDARVFAFNNDYTYVGDFPKDIPDSKVLSNPVVGDVDGDGEYEIVILNLTEENHIEIYVLEKDGTSPAGPKNIDQSAGGDEWFACSSDPFLYDIDEDEIPEIIFVAVREIAGEYQALLYIYSVSNNSLQQVSIPGGKVLPCVSPLAAGSIPEGTKVIINPLLVGLQGCWKFEDNFADFSGNGYTLEEVGTVGFAPGMYGGNAVEFINAPDEPIKSYLMITETPEFLNIQGDLTISAWVNMYDFNKNCEIVRKFNGYSLEVNRKDPDNDDHRELVFREPGKGYKCSYLFETDQWYHVAVVRENGECTLYINGSEQPTEPDSELFLPLQEGDLFLVGSNGKAQDTNGSIDEILVHNRAVSVYEMGLIYNLQLGIPVEDQAEAKEIAVYVNIGTESGYKLFGIAQALTGEWGLLSGYPVEIDSVLSDTEDIPSLLPAPTVYPAADGDKVMVLGIKNLDGINYVAIYIVSQNEESVSIKDCPYYYPGIWEVKRVGNISLADIDEDGKLEILPVCCIIDNLDMERVYCHFLDYETIMNDGGNCNFDNIYWGNNDGFDSTYLEAIVAKLTLDDETTHYYLFGNKAKKETGEGITLVDSIDNGVEDDSVRASAVADLDGNGFSDIATVTTGGNLYIKTPGIEGVPLAQTQPKINPWPYCRWMEQGTNCVPEIITDPDVDEVQIEPGEELLVYVNYTDENVDDVCALWIDSIPDGPVTGAVCGFDMLGRHFVQWPTSEGDGGDYSIHIKAKDSDSAEIEKVINVTVESPLPELPDLVVENAHFGFKWVKLYFPTFVSVGRGRIGRKYIEYKIPVWFIKAQINNIHPEAPINESFHVRCTTLKGLWHLNSYEKEVPQGASLPTEVTFYLNWSDVSEFTEFIIFVDNKHEIEETEEGGNSEIFSK